MNTQAIENFIESVCRQLDEKIGQAQNEKSEYMTKLREAPDLIKAQAKASLRTLEDGRGINLLVAVLFTQKFLEYMKSLDTIFDLCSPNEKRRLSQLQLAPFQINLLARQLAIAPGIIKQYEDLTKGNS